MFWAQLPGARSCECAPTAPPPQQQLLLAILAAQLRSRLDEQTGGRPDGLWIGGERLSATRTLGCRSDRVGVSNGLFTMSSGTVTWTTPGRPCQHCRNARAIGPNFESQLHVFRYGLQTFPGRAL